MFKDALHLMPCKLSPEVKMKFPTSRKWILASYQQQSWTWRVTFLGKEDIFKTKYINVNITKINQWMVLKMKTDRNRFLFVSWTENSFLHISLSILKLSYGIYLVSTKFRHYLRKWIFLNINSSIMIWYSAFLLYIKHGCYTNFSERYFLVWNLT